MELEEVLEYIAELENTDLESVVYDYEFGLYDDLIKELLSEEKSE